MFSYKAQVDDAMDEDTVSLPHQQSFSSLKTDSDYIYQVHTPSIHMPLYDSQASKSFISKQRASLYSLTSTKDPKVSDANPYVNSQVTLYCSTSGVRSLGRRLSAEKGTSEFTNHPLIKSAALSDSQKSSPDLRFSGPSWKAVSVAHIKYGGPSSVSNLLLSTDTASNFLYKPKANDSNVNLFPQTRKNSLESTLDKTTVDYAVERVSRGACSSGSADALPAPALENTLQSILDSGTRDNDAEDPQEYPLKASDTDALVKGSLAGAHHSIGHSMITRRYDAQVRSGNISPDVSADAPNATQRLLPRSTSFCTADAYRKNRNDSKDREPGGLNDYLLSVTSPKFQKHYGRNETRLDPESSRDHPDSYAQTESL